MQAHGPIQRMLVLLAATTTAVLMSSIRISGTHQQNMQEMCEAGRSNRGERHPLCRIADVEVAHIRKLWSEGATQKAIALLYEIHEETVGRYVRGVTRA
jgi:hypothetical protein